MIVIIDTNVVVSAVIRDWLPQRVIEEIVSRDDWFWVVTRQIEAEYRELLSRPKFNLTTSIQQDWLTLIEAATISFEPDTEIQFPRDPRDMPFLAAALASEADYLITGDKDFSEAQHLINCRIISVAEFARTFSIA